MGRPGAVYASEGFVEEGRLRECLTLDAGFESLIVMGMLEREYEARIAQGIE